MPFIGILAKKNDYSILEKEIQNNCSLNKLKVIELDKDNIEIFKNIKFDMIIINSNIKNILDRSNYFIELMKKSNYIMLNTDIQNNTLFMQYLKANIITYGFNRKATITISSIKDDKIMIGVQRNILYKDKDVLCMQEVVLNASQEDIKNVYDMMILFTISNIYGKN